MDVVETDPLVDNEFEALEPSQTTLPPSSRPMLPSPEALPLGEVIAPSPTWLQYHWLAIVPALLLFAVYLLFRRRLSAKREVILLLGSSDAGKTAIMSSLAYSVALPSHTSLQVNTFIVSLSPDDKETTRLVDVPGHPRIRAQFSEYLSSSKAVVFVMDTITIARNGVAVAEHLHQILHALTSLPPSIPPPPLLLFAHKTDLLSNPSSNANLAIDRVRTVLERELEKRRLSAVGGVGVEGLGSEGEGDVNGMGGLECSTKDGSFKFAEWEGGRVDFASGWVDVARHDLGNETPEEEKAGIDGLASLKDWISGL